MDITQSLAADVINRVLKGKKLNDTLQQTLSHAPQLTPQQRSAVRDLCYGSLRYHNQLEALINSLTHRTIADPRLVQLLKVALYQLRFSQAPSHAIVNHAVAVATRWKPAASGLINAVLRRFLREKEEILGTLNRTAALQYALPEWWVQRLQQDHPNHWESIAQHGLSRPLMTLRINPKRCHMSDYTALLTEVGFPYRQLDEDAVLLKSGYPVEKLPRFADGWVSVQDWGAQRLMRALNSRDGLRVLDACAAPGGKMTYLLERFDMDILALDIDTQRMKRVADNLSRLGLKAQLQVTDACRLSEWWDGQRFDRILVDAPCSASGVIRRNPDIKWHRRLSDLAFFAQQQLHMLNTLWGCLKPGGQLFYISCSVFHQENRQTVNTFTDTHPDAQADPEKTGQYFPSPDHDGFFYASLLKKA